MSLEREVEHTVTVTNLAMAMMRAQDFDRVNCACGVAIMASVLAGQDRDARTMLAGAPDAQAGARAGPGLGERTMAVTNPRTLLSCQRP